MTAWIVIGLLCLWLALQRFYFWREKRKVDSLFEKKSSVGVRPSRVRTSRLMPLHLERIEAVSETSVGKQFKAQKERMEFQAMIPHEADCDIFTCRKPICFQRNPDVIVKEHAPGTVTVEHVLPADEFETIRFNDPLKRRRKKVD